MFELRGRPDGMIEIVVSTPTLVGIFPDREIAARVCAFLQAEDHEVPELAASNLETASLDALPGEAAAVSLADAVVKTEPAALRGIANARANLPAVVTSQPSAPARIEHGIPARLTDDQMNAAFRRIVDGEKIASIAPDFGLSMPQLRGLWANHRRKMQEYIASDGQKACVLCQRPFTPSLTHPDTCARCNHE